MTLWRILSAHSDGRQEWYHVSFTYQWVLRERKWNAENDESQNLLWLKMKKLMDSVTLFGTKYWCLLVFLKAFISISRLNIPKNTQNKLNWLYWAAFCTYPDWSCRGLLMTKEERKAGSERKRRTKRRSEKEKTEERNKERRSPTPGWNTGPPSVQREEPNPGVNKQSKPNQNVFFSHTCFIYTQIQSSPQTEGCSTSLNKFIFTMTVRKDQNLNY